MLLCGMDYVIVWYGLCYCEVWTMLLCGMDYVIVKFGYWLHKYETKSPIS